MDLQTPLTTERDVTFQSAGLTLAGTLLLPGAEARYPVVLLIPGSGPLDRDENYKKLPINALREIAVHLAGQGIASFRYDKRGVGASQGDYFETGFYDLVSDAAAALAWLRAQDQVQPEKVFLLGHSEGSGIAMRLAGTGADVAGIVLLGGWARKSEEMLLWQADQVVPGMRGFNKWLIGVLHIDIRKAQLKQFEKIKRSKKNVYRQLTVKVNAKWLREFLGYDPAEELRKIRVPVLAITGSKDIQVNPADLDRMAQLVQGEFESHQLPDLTHMLRTDSGQPTINTYAEQVRRPVDPRLLELVSEWLQRQVAREMELAFS
jgi:pimeloyl-ACP methyl ester carboxylesterase